MNGSAYQHSRQRESLKVKAPVVEVVLVFASSLFAVLPLKEKAFFAASRLCAAEAEPLREAEGLQSLRPVAAVFFAAFFLLQCLGSRAALARDYTHSRVPAPEPGGGERQLEPPASGACRCSPSRLLVSSARQALEAARAAVEAAVRL